MMRMRHRRAGGEAKPFFGLMQTGAEPYVPNFPHFYRNGEGPFMRALVATWDVPDEDLLDHPAIRSLEPVDFDPEDSKRAFCYFIAAESARLGIPNLIPAGGLRD
jgi:hypothetical protein